MKIIVMYFCGQSVPVQVCDTLEEAESILTRRGVIHKSTHEDYWIVPKKYSKLVEKCGHETV